jgi:ribosomal protein L22
MTEEPKNDDVEETTAGETPTEDTPVEETVAETTTEAAEDPGVIAPVGDDDKVVPDKPADAADEPVDQQARADAEAARAAAAAEEAAEAAEEAPTPTAVAAAEEAEELAEQAEAAAEEAATKPKRQRARKAREAEQAADQAEEAAEDATESAKRSRARRKQDDDETPAETAKPTTRRRRDERRPVPVGLEVRAQAKYVRTSARKARLVCDHIRGKDVVEARAILAFTPRRAAEAWIKLLESAVANAEHNHELVGEDLRILNVHADEGPTLKRFRPRAMGRATRIRKRTSHLSITLTPKES